MGTLEGRVSIGVPIYIKRLRIGGVFVHIAIAVMVYFIADFVGARKDVCVGVVTVLGHVVSITVRVLRSVLTHPTPPHGRVGFFVVHLATCSN